MTLQARDVMPMFNVTNSLDDTTFAYEDVWQRQNLVLVSIPRADLTGARYVEHLLARRTDLESDDVRLVVTADTVPGVPAPGVIVADRWGEVWFVQGAEQADRLSTADDLVEWVRFVQVQCPECQGEAH
jgi:hypothetical protein